MLDIEDPIANPQLYFVVYVIVSKILKIFPATRLLIIPIIIIAYPIPSAKTSFFHDDPTLITLTVEYAFCFLQILLV